ncbi:CU044_5270 family protein [Streptomyces pseudoechinosporeus]
MDELTRVRELRADAPVPDRARLAPGRARLLAAAQVGEPHRTVWGHRKAVVALVFVAVSAITVAASVLVDGGGGAGREVTPAVSSTAGPHLKGMSARELLDRAAAAVERQELIREPKGNEAIVTEQYLEYPGFEDAVRERWVRFAEAAVHISPAGPADWNAERRIVHESTEDWLPLSRSPKQVYDFLSALPADGEGTLKALREQNAVPDAKGAEQSERDFAEIAALLDADIQPLDGLASLYRALGTVPGGTVAEDLVEYGYGKRAIALRYPARMSSSANDVPASANDAPASATEWLLDPETYRPVGRRTLVNGELQSSITIVTRVIVPEEESRTD